VSALELIDRWPVDHAAAVVITAEGIVETRGDIHRPYPLASVTKLLTTYATLVALEEGAVTLDEPAGPATVRHLLAHASGIAFEERRTLAPPGRRRIYSNVGFDVLGEHLGAATGLDPAVYIAQAVFQPLAMTATVGGSLAKAAIGCAVDMAKFAAELMQPTLLDRSTLTTATTVQFPGIDGVLPGFGRQSPNDWGLGFELRSRKSPHWTGSRNSPSTFGHFGRSGTFVWVDPTGPLALVCLTDRAFDDWAKAAWPTLSDAVLDRWRQ